MLFTPEEGEEVKPITDLATPHRGVTVGRGRSIYILYRMLLAKYPTRGDSGRLGVGLLAARQACRGYPHPWCQHGTRDIAR